MRKKRPAGKRLPPKIRSAGARRPAAALLCAALLFGMLPLAAAGDADAPCPNHPEHDAACGYVEGVEARDCGHVHDDTCGYVKAADVVPCDKGCTDVDEDGEPVHDADCAYRPAAEGHDCGHVHDDACGYVNAVDSVPCTHSCKLCASPTGGEEPPPATNGPLNGPAFLDEPSEHTPQNLTDVLKYDTIVSYNNTPVSGDGPVELNAGDEFSVKVDFASIPLWDFDTEEPTINDDDYVNFSDLATGFSLKNGETVQLLCDIALEEEASKLVPVGEITFTTSDNGALNAKLTFDDGDNEVFATNGIDSLDHAHFSFSLSFDRTQGLEEGKTKKVTILGKTFIVKQPVEEKTYKVEKSGKEDLATGVIKWTVTVTGTKGAASTPLDLADYVFSDDLSNVGEYVTGSFKVNDAVVTPTNTAPTLTYTFPESSTSPQAIIFQTKIPDIKYYASTSQIVTNTAQLLDGEDVLAEGTGSASFTPQWIAKEGTAGGETGSSGEYTPNDRIITWTITANHYGASLNNVVITDTPKSPAEKELTLQSATLQRLSADGKTWEDAETIPDTKPDDGGMYWTEKDGKWEFHLGNISTKILLTIVTAVPTPGKGEHVTGAVEYGNSASLSWADYGKGITYAAQPVGIGYNAIEKKNTGYSAKDATIGWSVSVNAKGQKIEDMKVYDLLVYGAGELEFSKLTGFPDDLETSSLTQNLNQKYSPNSFSSTDGLTLNIISLKDGDTAVADLLVVTGTGGNGAIGTDKPYTFTYRSQVTDPSIFTKNGSTDVSNTAVLFSGNAKLNDAKATQGCDSQVLDKTALSVSAALDLATNPTAGNANTTTNSKSMFNYVDKSVVFRLVVNQNGMDLNEVGGSIGKGPGTVTVTDTLPDGWEFRPIKGGVNYLIFEGDTSGKAIGTPLTENLPTAVFEGSTAIATFTFSDLDEPYVILVKAGPTEETAKKYFNKNVSTPINNNAEFHATDWGMTSKDNQTVTISSEVLNKELGIKNADDGYLTWTVDYQPYLLTHTVGETLAIKDTLPQGVELRTDSKGALLLEDGNVKANLLTLNPDGTDTEGSSISLEQGKNLFYDNKTRVLRFEIEDPAQGCRLSYVTDITGDPGKINNTVKLTSTDFESVSSGKEYVVTDKDASAILTRSGWVQITMTGEGGAALSGVGFTLYAKDGTTVLRTGTTNAKGILTLRGLPDGKYLLRETAALEGYVLPPASYPVTVADKKAVFDGQTGSTLPVQNVKTGTVGNLTVEKEVTGNRREADREFAFTLTLTGTDGQTFQTLKGGVQGSLKSGDIFTLKDGERLTVYGIPKETTYTVEETDYSGDGYVTTASDDAGTIEADKTAAARFTNRRDIFGTLSVLKVSQESGQPLSGAEFQLTGGGKTYGPLITGADGRVTFADLPLDLALILTEVRAPEGYQTTPPQRATLTNDEELVVTVTNTLKPVPTPTPTPGNGGGGGGSSDNKPAPSPEVSPSPTPSVSPSPTPTAVPSPEISPAPSPDISPDPTASPALSPAPESAPPSTPSEPAPTPPSAVELPKNGIRGEVRPDDSRYYLDDDGVPRGIPPVADPDYWLDDAGIPLGYRGEDGEWEWIEDNEVPLGFVSPAGDWVDFVPQTGDHSAALLLVFLLSGGAVLGLTGYALLVRRSRGRKRP